MKAYLIAAVLAGTAGAAIAQAPAPVPMGANDRIQTRDSVVAKVRDRFARADANRDGFVAGDEIRAQRAERRAKRMAIRGGQQRANPDAGFERLDTNRDNMISREEFAAGRAMRGQRMGAMRGQRMGMRGQGMRGQGGMLRRADADRDGRVSLAEAQAAALQRFDRVDLNRDGRITPDERQQMRQQRMQRRAPGAG